MSRLFGTDGVRGLANHELSGELAFKLAFATARRLTEKKGTKPSFLIGMDTRLSCDMLESALVAGLTSAGADAYCTGVIPTPGIAYLVKTYGHDAGIVISASHNSYEFNGIKIFSGEGFKLPDEIEDEIEARMDAIPAAEERLGGQDLGRRIALPDAADDYRRHLESVLELDLKEFKIAVDCANGAASRIAPGLFRDLGAEVIAIGNEPDGLNINHKCGSTDLTALKACVKAEGCDLGLAFDGDADRMLAIDNLGEEVDGDVIMAILARDMKNEGLLHNNRLVVTVMSNLGLDQMAEREGIVLAKTKVGDRYVLEEMLNSHAALGGEQSGHIILLDHATSGDGMLSALYLLRAIQKSQMELSELKGIMTVLPQVLINVLVPNELKSVLMADPLVNQAVERVEEQLKRRGRLLLRPSGTEPKIRVMLEGNDQVEIDQLAHQIADLLKERCKDLAG